MADALRYAAFPAPQSVSQEEDGGNDKPGLSWPVLTAAIPGAVLRCPLSNNLAQGAESFAP